jgi:serine/threonine-protein kinase
MQPPQEKQSEKAAELPDRPNMIGRVLSERYRIDRLIATGSFGAVYQGVHLHMHKQVAIKVLHPEIENFPELIERFEREAVAGAHISHPNVAVASDLGKFDGDSYFLVQEYVPGETLRKAIDRGAMPAARAAFIARQIAAGLGAAHRHKIVHRDLKPANVMLVDGSDDFVKLIDFGFARVPVEELPHAPKGDSGPEWLVSEAGVVFGSVGYMAPEAALGMRNVKESADLYALGLIFYEMLAGEHPFDLDLPPGELFKLQRNAIPPPLLEKNPNSDVPPDLDTVVTRLLAKEPEQRYPSASAAIAAIDAAMRNVEGYIDRGRSDRFRRPRAEAKPVVSVAEPKVEAKPLESLKPAIGEQSILLTSLAARRRRGRAIGGVIAVFALAAAALWVVFRLAESDGSGPAASASAPAISALPPPPPAPSESARGNESFDQKFVRELKDKLISQAEKAKSDEAARTWLMLMEANPKALDDVEVQNATVALAKRAEREDESTDKVFYQLAYRSGAIGLDLLFRVLDESPGTRAAQRAESIPAKQGGSERASPGLRITLEIRRMTCEQKAMLFERAGREGDERTLRQLEGLRPPACATKKGACCFKDNLKLEKAIGRIRDRSKNEAR